MTASADKIFQQTQLAEAAYADFWDSDTKSVITDRNRIIDVLEARGFSKIQATQFVEDWQIVTHQSNTSSGFSATLFQNRETGEFVYAIRGTEPGMADLVGADAGDIVLDGVALDQTVDLYNDWLRVTTPKGLTYQAAVLTTLETESERYRTARKLMWTLGAVMPGTGILVSEYLGALRARTDIVIDEPSGLVRKIEFKNSMEAFSDSSRKTGAGITVANLSVAGHSLGEHLAAANQSHWRIAA